MVDIWSGIGVEISKSSGEWLYRVGEDMRGPVPIKALAEKLIKGELPLTTPVALEGGEFHPVVQVKAFAVHIAEAKKAARKRNAAKVRRILLVSVLVLLAGGAIGGFFVYEAYKKDEAARLAEKQRLADEARRLAEERSKLGQMDLVALVTLGTEAEVKIKSERRAAPRPKSTGKAVEESKAAPKAEDFVSDCTRSQGDILAALGKHVAKLNVCVLEEKKGPEGNLLPSTLEIEFVVRPDGKVVEFGITDRHYRAGALKNCMTKVFNGIKYPTAGGSNCPVTLPLKIGS
ncbi:MAG: hypothetical protein HY903_17475 [Deltaproteobacteria bacterium]|nr:hypothetical protein [Deltaproteobacteria bacterium]